MLYNPKVFNTPPFKTLNDIKGLKVTIMGLGLNGGGLASARFFAEHGAIVTITDTKTEQALISSLTALNDFPHIRYVLGKHEQHDFESADTVIKNPGVKLEGNPYLAVSKSIETDISVFLRFSQAPLIAVSGSKGKSSTVSAIQAGFKNLHKKSFLGGNITLSPLNFLAQTNEHTPVILELSSWQLADLKGRGLLKPRVAILTPVMSDHQNWYGSMDAYVADKKLIYADMDSLSYLLCNAEDGWGPIFAQETKSCVLWYSSHPLMDKQEGAWIAHDGRGMARLPSSISNHPFQEILEILPQKLAVPGEHMRQNLLCASLALILFGEEVSKVGPALAKFTGIEHRLEFFYEKNGIKFYNDSAATIPEAVVQAIQAFDEPILLLTGGTDKNLDFTPLAQNAEQAKQIFLLSGSGTDKLILLLKQKNIAYEGPFNSLHELIQKAVSKAQMGDRIVFSPGATSFGMFTNEFDRGNQFRDLVKKLV